MGSNPRVVGVASFATAMAVSASVVLFPSQPAILLPFTATAAWITTAEIHVRLDSGTRGGYISRAFSPNCEECGDPVVGPRAFVKGKPWHRECVESQGFWGQRNE